MKRNAVTVYGFVLGSQLLAVLEDAERSREDTEPGEDIEEIICHRDVAWRSRNHEESGLGVSGYRGIGVRNRPRIPNGNQPIPNRKSRGFVGYSISSLKSQSYPYSYSYSIRAWFVTGARTLPGPR
jgi:hypothetical protein